jgi:hypothetical protein
VVGAIRELTSAILFAGNPERADRPMGGEPGLVPSMFLRFDAVNLDKARGRRGSQSDSFLWLARKESN